MSYENGTNNIIIFDDVVVSGVLRAPRLTDTFSVVAVVGRPLPVLHTLFAVQTVELVALAAGEGAYRSERRLARGTRFRRHLSIDKRRQFGTLHLCNVPSKIAFLEMCYHKCT